tara:strand:- start:9705 stop:10622 length:918 start_codon:yes stop_codon:yes gene_type:complete
MKFLRKKLFYIFKGMRPYQINKNLIIYTAPLFSFSFNYEIWLNATYTIISFFFVSGSIYLINDSLDKNKDKLHARKKFRVIASGLLSVRLAILSSIVIFLITIITTFYFNQNIALVLLIYFISQLAYSLRIKNIPIIEIFFVSSGFILRTISGALASNLEISPWFIISIGFIALFLVVEKRKAEFILYKNSEFKTRKVLKEYSLELLNKYENLLANSSFLTYTLWASGPNLNGSPTIWMLLTTPFVLIGIFRYQFLSDHYIKSKVIENQFSLEEPEKIFVLDNFSKVNFIVWFSSVIFIGYICIY